MLSLQFQAKDENRSDLAVIDRIHTAPHGDVVHDRVVGPLLLRGRLAHPHRARTLRTLLIPTQVIPEKNHPKKHRAQQVILLF